MTTLEAINWIDKCIDVRLTKGGPCRWQLEVREGDNRYEIVREGTLGEVLPALVLGVIRLMAVKP